MINKIYHCADIHIRLLKRHKEYREVFQRFYDYIDQTKEKDDVIVIAGDIVHNKIEISSELIVLVSEFFNECANRLPTIVILGNHDLNLKNTSRIDPITPIVNSLKHPNLHYWRENGVYELNGVHFSVMSVLADPKDWIKADDIDGNYKIALCHAPIHGSKTSTEYKIDNPRLPSSIFDGFDLTLLGDIHTRQFLNTEKTIAFPSSLLQQNHGESIDGHGLIVWDVKQKEGNFVDIQNDYCYCTLEFKDGEWINQIQLPKYVRARIKYENTSKEDIHKILDQITGVEFLEILYQNIQSNSLDVYTTNELVKDTSKVEVQNDYISEYLRDSLNITDQKILDVILEINKESNKHLEIKEKIHRGIVWKPITFEWSNMFSYGSNNKVDLTDFRGTIGLFAENASGKSSLLNALAFCLYDKCSVGSKGSHILNNRKDEFHCKLQFQVGNDEFVIERNGARQKNDSVRVDVNFWKNGGLLNGKDRNETNSIIREHIGTYEDFIVTCVSTQVGTESFVDKTQAERKVLLYKLLDIDIFQDLYSIASEQKREIDVRLKIFNEEQLRSDLLQKRTEIENLETEGGSYKEQQIVLKKLYQNKEVEIGALENKINRNIISLDIDELNGKRSEIQQLLEGENIRNAERSKELIVLQEKIDSIQIDSTRKFKLEECIKELDILDSEAMQLNSRKGELERELVFINDQIEHLENHEYDPNCQYCVKNPFVEKAILARDKKPEIEKDLNVVISKIYDLSNEISLIPWENPKNELDRIRQLEKDKETYIHGLDVLLERIESGKKYTEQLNERLIYINEQIDLFHKQEEQLKKNAELKIQIASKIEELNILNIQISKCDNQLRNIQIKLASLESDKKQLESSISEFKKFKFQQQCYEYYLKSVSKEGVPYRILSIILPLIEFKVNEILHGLVEFQVKLYAEGDKYINMDIVYGENKYWGVEMASGMERFIISQAIRIALTNITSLPKPNFIAIDEGFGVLDSNNLASIYLLFEQLKEKIDFIICISHIESMRDIVNDTITIQKDEDNFSRILN